MIPVTNVGGKIATINEVADDQKATFVVSCVQTGNSQPLMPTNRPPLNDRIFRTIWIVGFQQKLAGQEPIHSPVNDKAPLTFTNE
jgi:hypothetical protein